jgi:hypothetical protein
MAHTISSAAPHDVRLARFNPGEGSRGKAGDTGWPDILCDPERDAEVEHRVRRLHVVGPTDLEPHAVGVSQVRKSRVSTGMISQVSENTMSTLRTNVRSPSGQAAIVGPRTARINVMTA